MSLRINKADAKRVLLEEAERAREEQSPAKWVQRDAALCRSLTGWSLHRCCLSLDVKFRNTLF